LAGLLIAHGTGLDTAGWRSLGGSSSDGAGDPPKLVVTRAAQT